MELRGHRANERRLTVAIVAVIVASIALICCACLGFTAAYLHDRLSRLEDLAGDPPASLWEGLIVPSEAVQRLQAASGTALFVSATCLACQTLLAELAASQESTLPGLVIVAEPTTQVPAALTSVVRTAGFDDLGVQVTPMAVALLDGVVVGANPISDLDALQRFQQHHPRIGSRPQPLTVGD